MMNGKLLVLLSGKQALPGYSKNLCVQGQRSPTRQTFYSSSPVSHPMFYTASPFPREDSSPLKFSLPVTNPQPLLPCHSEGRITATLRRYSPTTRCLINGGKKKKKRCHSLPISTLAKPVAWLWEDFLPLFEASGQNPAHAGTALVCLRSHAPPAPGPRRQQRHGHSTSLRRLKDKKDFSRYICSFCTQATVQSIIKYDCATDLFVFLLY